MINHNIWVNYNDLTVLPHWNHVLFYGNHPQMAELFRLVTYYILPTYIYTCIFILVISIIVIIVFFSLLFLFIINMNIYIIVNINYDHTNYYIP